ncbi:MAG: hypothetical protein K6A23_01465 [Butyrivibrio sp.]|nr:hypothetical protein [Butyrivibrio sp.]
MSKMILCTGAYASTPYFVEKIGKNIYSIEELCYIIVQNAFLIDIDSFDDELIDWIGKECKLEKLSDELRFMHGKKVSAAAFAGTILEYVRYNTDEEIQRTEEILKANSNMNVIDKRMARADYLLQNKNYELALHEYHYLLEHIPEIDSHLKAVIEQNTGIIYANMFAYNKAAEMFMAAYEDGHQQESYLAFLAAKRLSMSEREYVEFISENRDNTEISLKLEHRMDEALDLYSGSRDNHLLRTMAVYKSESKMAEYYEQLDKIAVSLKAEYRSLVGDMRNR